jgi:hypothetical protein
MFGHKKKVDQEVTQKREEKPAKNTSSTQTNKGHLTTVDIEHFKQLVCYPKTDPVLVRV